MAVPYYNARGEKRVHGGKDLKSSQHYPDQWLCLLNTMLHSVFIVSHVFLQHLVTQNEQITVDGALNFPTKQLSPGLVLHWPRPEHPTGRRTSALPWSSFAKRGPQRMITIAEGGWTKGGSDKLICSQSLTSYPNLITRDTFTFWCSAMGVGMPTSTNLQIQVGVPIAKIIEHRLKMSVQKCQQCDALRGCWMHVSPSWVGPSWSFVSQDESHSLKPFWFPCFPLIPWQPLIQSSPARPPGPCLVSLSQRLRSSAGLTCLASSLMAEGWLWKDFTRSCLGWDTNGTAWFFSNKKMEKLVQKNVRFGARIVRDVAKPCDL